MQLHVCINVHQYKYIGIWDNKFKPKPYTSVWVKDTKLNQNVDTGINIHIWILNWSSTWATTHMNFCDLEKFF